MLKPIVQQRTDADLQEDHQNRPANWPMLLILLIGADKFSARFFDRQLCARVQGRLSVATNWLNSAKDGISALTNLSGAATTDLPDLMVADLKNSATANLSFLQLVSGIIARTPLKLAVLMSSKQNCDKSVLKDAGAKNVFERHFNFEVNWKACFHFVHLPHLRGN